MRYDEQKVLKAWKTFINQGIIPENHVRPVIARSWQRCRERGLDPWSVDFPKPMPDRLCRKREDNARFLQAINPVLGYLLAMCNCNISFCDGEGFVFEFLSPLSMYPRTFGTQLTEEHVGTGNVPLALIEKKPVLVTRYEHYRVVSQDYAGASAPVMLSRQEMLGAVNINDPFGALPASALDLCVEAAKMVEALAKDLEGCESWYASAKVFQELIDKHTDAVFVVDQDGMILIANQAALHLVGAPGRLAYAGRSLAEYLWDKNDLMKVLEAAPGPNEQETVSLRGAARSVRQRDIPLLRRRMIELPGGQVNNLLVMEAPPDKGTRPTVRVPELNRSGGQTVDYIGSSPKWQQVHQTIQRIAGYKSNVLLLGETGTGKEVAAKAIHKHSGRKGEFVAINCGAIPKDLLASELFGYVGGAFTGAKSAGSMGKFEYAAGGTLFLDEIGEMPVDMQVSLLRVLQDQTIIKVGSNKPQKIDVRLVAATNREIRELIEQGKFRADLYYRLSVIEIHLPPLKEREDDVILLAEHFQQELAHALQMDPSPLTPEAVELMRSYSWPGNVRELRNIMEKTLIMTNGEPIRAEDFPEYIQQAAAGAGKPEPVPEELRAPTLPREDYLQPEARPAASKEEKREKEKAWIARTLEHHGGNISKAAKELNMSRNTLYRKIKKYNIEIRIQVNTSKNEG